MKDSTIEDKSIPHYWKHRTGKRANRWQGGRFVYDGYVNLIRNGKRFKEHRVIYEQYHKCCLLPKTDIHHINGNKLDNRIENLEVLSRKDHARFHRLIILSKS